MNVWGNQFTIEKWQHLVSEYLDSGNGSPIININPTVDREFDAIYLGGGADGRFGAAYCRALGGRVLIIDRWPFLGGSCPHQACVPHHLFSDCSAQLMLERTFSGKLWFQNLNDKIGIHFYHALRCLNRYSLHFTHFIALDINQLGVF